MIVPRKNSDWNWPWYQTTAWPAVPPTSASKIRRRLAALPKLSRHGEVDARPADLSRLNSGVSWSRIRMIKATTTRMTDRMNGIRQPKLVKSSADIDVRVTPMTTSASSNPSVAVV